MDKSLHEKLEEITLRLERLLLSSKSIEDKANYLRRSVEDVHYEFSKVVEQLDEPKEES